MRLRPEFPVERPRRVPPLRSAKGVRAAQSGLHVPAGVTFPFLCAQQMNQTAELSLGA
jgi:hypothetical protein